MALTCVHGAGLGIVIGGEAPSEDGERKAHGTARGQRIAHDERYECVVLCVVCVALLTQCRRAAMEISFTLKEIPASVDRSKWPVIPNYTEVQEELEKGLQLLEKYKKAVTDEG